MIKTSLMFAAAAVALSACGTGELTGGGVNPNGGGDGDGGGGGTGGVDAAGHSIAPELVPGGGVTSGAIAGVVHVHVVDARADSPIAGAEVYLGDRDRAVVTDGSGLASFSGDEVSGPQTIAAVADGFAPATWLGVNGANVTIALSPTPTPAVATARASGTIAGGLPNPPFGMYTLAVVLYSASDLFGSAENAIEQPASGDLPQNVCMNTGMGDSSCSWNLITRTGPQLHYAVVVQGDPNGTPSDPADDIFSLVGYAIGQPVDLAPGAQANGQQLTLIAADQLATLQVAFPAAPSGLSALSALPFIDLGEEGFMLFPMPALQPGATSTRVPALTGAFAGMSYVVMGFARASADGDRPYSASYHRSDRLSGTISLADWLSIPGDVRKTGSELSFTPVSGASLHLAALVDASGNPAWNAVIADGRASFSLSEQVQQKLPGGALELRIDAVDLPGATAGSFRLVEIGERVERLAEAAVSAAR